MSTVTPPEDARLAEPARGSQVEERPHLDDGERGEDAARPAARPPEQWGEEDGGVLAASVREVHAVEQEERDRESREERIASRITAATGSMAFVVANVVWFAAWIILNLPGMPTQFDPFPFALLTMVVSLEAIVLSILVLISENSQARRSDRRARIDMQVNVLAEREITRLVAMVDQIHQHLGLERDREDEVDEMERETPLDEVAQSVDAATD